MKNNYVAQDKNEKTDKTAMTEIKYKRKEELENLNKKLIAKIIRDLNNKYNGLFTDKNVTADYFSKEILNEIQKYFDFNNPDYNKFFQKLEKVVLSKLNKITDKKRDNMLSKDEVQEIAVSNFNKSETTGKTSAYNYIPEGKIKRLKLREQLRKKENDEWAKITDYDYKNFLTEKKNKEKQSQNVKTLYNNELYNQIKTRKEIDKSLINEEKQKVNELLKMSSNFSKLQEEEKIKKILNDKKVYNLIIKENERNREIAYENLKSLKNEVIKIDEEMIELSNKDELIRENNAKNKLECELKLQKYLEMQIEEKHIRELEMSRNKVDDKKVISKLLLEEEQTNKKIIKIKNDFKINYKRDLDEQLIIRQKYDSPFMNETEKSINKRILQKIK